MIPHYRPSFNQSEIKAVKAVIKSKHIAQGEKVLELENRLSNFVEKKYCIAVSSGTSALTLALLSLKIGSGDEVIIPSYTCSALWHAVKAVGSSPVFADIEISSFNLDPEDIKQKITSKTRAIIFPHMFGQPGRIEEVLQFKIPVIEDIAQAVGAKINNSPVGSFGDISVISFYATKVIGAGEGGCILSNSKKFANNVLNLREYDEKDNLTLKYNAKMTDITAAIALEQLKKLSNFIDRRKTIFLRYKSILKNNVDVPLEDYSGYEANYYRCIATHPKIKLKKILKTVKNMGVKFRRPVYKPLHLYNQREHLKNSEETWEKQFSVPIYPDLSENEINLVLSTLKHIFI